MNNTLFLIHGYLPAEFMSTVIIPLVKDKKGDLSDVNNYRPIALTTIISKLFELIILEKCSDYFYTSDHQFGFKKGHGTEECIFTMKQVIEYYTLNSSPVYLCFMDLSKAFDMVNHDELFSVLYNRGIHYFIVRILHKWYVSQKFMIKWGYGTSKAFSVSNGTRQGSILSPYLFNIYIDELSGRLQTAAIGCHINATCFNHLLYADDSVLLAPSPRAMQSLINLCSKFATEKYLVYNRKKTKIMMLVPNSRKNLVCPTFFIDGAPIQQVKKVIFRLLYQH